MTNIREKINESIATKLATQRPLLLNKEIELKNTIMERLLNTVGMFSIKEDLERARTLINVSSKNMYFFKKPDTDKIFALIGEELIVGEEKVVILKSFRKGDSKIVTKDELLSNPALIAVSTIQTTLNGLKLKANTENNIEELFELPKDKQKSTEMKHIAPTRKSRNGK